MLNTIKDYLVLSGIENKLNKIFKNPQLLQKIDIYNNL